MYNREDIGSEMKGKLNILLVDDDPDEKHAFAGVIRQLGLPATLMYAASSSELFAYLEEESDIQLIFLDINMPVVDGKECLKTLKASKKYRHIPVVVYTVSESQQDIDEVYASGAHYYAIKPYASSNFMQTMKHIFSADWSKPQAIPAKEDFVINLAFV